MTPHLAGLAKRLVGRPFHLIVTHMDPAGTAALTAHLRAEGLTEDVPQLTVATRAGHPGFRGAAHVPYYILFDHTGRLARHHMCGDDHDGADGLQMIEWVDNLLAKIPPIAVGSEPYSTIADIAEQVAFKRDLAATVKQLESESPRTEGVRATEMQRLLGHVAAWRDARIEAAMAHLASDPKEAIPALEALSNDLKGTALVTPVAARIASLRAAPELKAALKLAAALEKTEKKLARLKVPRAAAKRGVERFRLDDPECRKAHARTLAREARSLRKSLEGHEGLPIAARVRQLIAKLEG